jgi:hypothetical protein
VATEVVRPLKELGSPGRVQAWTLKYAEP